MSKECRVVELQHVNELFLQFCVAYGTPEQEKYREAYERAVEAKQQAMEPDTDEAQEKVSRTRDHALPDVRTVGLSLVRPSAQEALHNNSGGV